MVIIIMPKENEDLDVKYHEKIAKGCFNQTWDLIAKKDDRDYFFEDLNGGQWFGMK